MAGWDTHQGRAVLLAHDNIDTDQLIPARFMSVPRSEGYGDYLFHDARRDADGTPDPAFPLNAHKATILVAGRNFGSGSSREAAVYALIDAGIRAVIAPGFGDIFAANAVNNGLLPARISDADAQMLADRLETPADIQIDLTAKTLSLDGVTIHFELDETPRTKLVNGWDDIDLTLQYGAAIHAYADTRNQTAPWAWPRTD